jgi:galactokinase
MDQLACILGGAVAIDFASPAMPKIEKAPLDLAAEGYGLCIVNTGGNHADLTEDYASVPAEMKAVASFFGKSVLREVDCDELTKKIPELREAVGDRADLRALHFLRENERVMRQKECLSRADLEGFFAEVLASGRSSFCYLQNVYTTKNLREQGISLALCLCDEFFASKKLRGAWRVHGGGFAGTIQAYVPLTEIRSFRAMMESVFGESACTVLRIRPVGAVKIEG